MDISHSKSTNLKESIRKEIRHATINFAHVPAPSLDLAKSLFPPIENVPQTFLDNFSSAGGKWHVSPKERFKSDFFAFLNGQKYNAIFNASPLFTRMLFTEKNSHVYNALMPGLPMDAVVVYADILIARSGSLLFSQKYLTTPSVKNIANDLIICAFASHIVPDLKDALHIQKQMNKDVPLEFTEIVMPQPPLQENGKSYYTTTNPRFILLLINDLPQN